MVVFIYDFKIILSDVLFFFKNTYLDPTQERTTVITIKGTYLFLILYSRYLVRLMSLITKTFQI